MTDASFAQLPAPPYYAVIFSSRRAAGDGGEAAEAAPYDNMSERMVTLARQQPGFLGAESARDAQGFGITVSYWADEASIRAWKNNAEHRIAQETGMQRWYEHYETRVAKVERAYSLK